MRLLGRIQKTGTHVSVPIQPEIASALRRRVGLVEDWFMRRLVVWSVNACDGIVFSMFLRCDE